MGEELAFEGPGSVAEGADHGGEGGPEEDGAVGGEAVHVAVGSLGAEEDENGEAAGAGNVAGEDGGDEVNGEGGEEVSGMADHAFAGALEGEGGGTLAGFVEEGNEQGEGCGGVAAPEFTGGDGHAAFEGLFALFAVGEVDDFAVGLAGGAVVGLAFLFGLPAAEPLFGGGLVAHENGGDAAMRVNGAEGFALGAVEGLHLIKHFVDRGAGDVGMLGEALDNPLVIPEDVVAEVGELIAGGVEAFEFAEGFDGVVEAGFFPGEVEETLEGGDFELRVAFSVVAGLDGPHALKLLILADSGKAFELGSNPVGEAVSGAVGHWGKDNPRKEFSHRTCLGVILTLS